MDDLAGLGKVAEVILDSLEKACGTLYEPTRIKRKAHADAQALLIHTDAEMKAEVMKRNGLLLSEDIENEERLTARAGQRLITQERLHQRNLEHIAQDSLSHTNPEKESRPLEDDWINAFIHYAQGISAEGVREIWSQILASQATEGEPAVSRATLDALRLLEPKHARYFERAFQLFVGLGAILDTEPTDENERSFNINELLALALEDIGFLKRMNEQASSLALREGTLTFWNPFEIVSLDLEPYDARIAFYQKPAYTQEILNHVCSVTASDVTGPKDARKDIQIQQMILTSRGYELSAVSLPQAYAGISRNPPFMDEPELGAYAQPEIRQAILNDWAELFTQQGAFVVKNEHIKGTGKIQPTQYFDVMEADWKPIRD